MTLSHLKLSAPASRDNVRRNCGGTVLVVDDEASQRALISQTLAGAFAVRGAASVAEALEEASRETPAAVIMDYAMPEMTGIEGLKKFRELFPAVPVVMLTGYAELEIAREAIQLGAAEYIIKPFEPADLLQTLQRCASRHVPAPEARDKEVPYSLQRRLAAGVDLWRSRMPTVPSENRVQATLAGGQNLEAKVLRLSRRVVQAEVYDPLLELSSGQAVEHMQVFVGEELAYDGPAALGNVVSTGVTRVCEFLMHGDWINGAHEKPVQLNGNMAAATLAFINRWQNTRDIRPEFMLAVADAAAFLSELRSWLEGMELSWEHSGSEQDALEDLFKMLVPVMNGAFARFEAEAALVPDALMGIHAEYLRSSLHPLLLCSPFVHRCFTKPLGYPGDYGMMNRMLDAPFEGDGLYARILNAWVVRSGAGDAYRHRVRLIENVLRTETVRVTEQGRVCRVLSLGCGAAREVQHFVRRDPRAAQVAFTLMDFNPGTVRHAQEQIAAAAGGREIDVTAMEFSVHQMLAAGARLAKRTRSGPLERGSFDVVYCAGLFDYLSDRICRRLLEIFWDLTAPGGTVVISNFAPTNPIRGFMDYALDWRLIHRDEKTVRSLAVDESRGAISRTLISPDQVEVYLQMRRPEGEPLIAAAQDSLDPPGPDRPPSAEPENGDRSS